MAFQFEDFVLDPARRELRRADTRIAVEPQVFDLLHHLIRHRERVVTRDDMLDAVWNGRVVSESTLTSRINAARRAINDSGEAQRLIRTVARKGVRFVGEVTETAEAGTAVPAAATPHTPALPLPDRPAIAVLPFINMSGEPEQDYFSDGISEDIITALSKLRWFFVIARNSSFTYKDKTVLMRQVAEELGVRYVVEGSVRRGGDRVRITAQLNDVATGSHLWAERYDREFADVFAVQDEITENIVAAIEPKLYAAESFRAQRKPPDSMDAWDLVMRALSHYWRVTRQDMLVAQALLEKAIALDPELWPGARAARLGLHVHGAYGLDGARPPPCRWPSASRTPRSGPMARIPGRTTRSATSICSRTASRIRLPRSRPRCGSTRTSRWRRAITAWRSAIADAGRTPTRPPAARSASARAIPIRRSITASPPTPASSAATMRRRSGSPMSRCASAATSSARTGC